MTVVTEASLQMVIRIQDGIAADAEPTAGAKRTAGRDDVSSRSHSVPANRHTAEEDAMKYVLLIFHGPMPPLPGSERWKALPESEQKAIVAQYADLNQTPGFTPGLPLGLPGAAMTVQVRDGKPEVRNGPYLNEGAGGYAVFEAESMDAAIALAARIPAARLGGAIEIRPAAQYW